MPLRPAGYRFAPGHRIRVSVASSAWPVLWPSPFPTRRSSSTAAPRRRRASSCRSCRRPAARATWPSRPSRRRRPDQPPVGGEGSADEPVWRISTTSSPARVTVTIHDGGEDVLDDGRRLYCGRDADADRVRRRPARGEPRRRRRLSLARARVRGRDPGALAARRATPTAFHLTVDLEVDLDGEPFFRADLARDASRAASSERSRVVDCRPCRVPGSRPRPSASPNRSSAR